MAPVVGKITVSGNGVSQVFCVAAAGDSISLSGLSIVHGQGASGGGVFITAGNVALSQVTLAKNQAVGSAGTDGDAGEALIFNLGGFASPPSNNASAFNNNEAEGARGGGLGQGGSIFNLGTLSITGSTFQGNQAAGGSDGVGGLLSTLLGKPRRGRAIANAVTGVASVSGSAFAANKVVGGSDNSGGLSPSGVGLAFGGGIANELGATLSLSNCSFTSNQALGGSNNQTGVSATLGDLGLAGVGTGGGIANLLASNATVAASTFTSNQALGSVGDSGALGPFFVGSGIGGGMANFFAAITVNGGTFQSNQAKGGSGISNGSVGGQGAGGALANFGALATATISGPTLTGNLAQGGASGTGQVGGNAAGGAWSIPSAPSPAFGIL